MLVDCSVGVCRQERYLRCDDNERKPGALSGTSRGVLNLSFTQLTTLMSAAESVFSKI